MDGEWRTIRGVHVLIGKDGSILKGPKSLQKKDIQKKLKKQFKEKSTKEQIKELEKELEEAKGIFQKGAIQEKINALKEGKTVEEYRKAKMLKQQESDREYQKEKQIRLKEEKEATMKENAIKYQNIKVEEINEEDLKAPKEGYTRLYRGLNNEFDKSYDRTSIDNPNGYESWTDNPNLAKEYGKNVYFMDVPTKDIGTEVLDKNGNRYMTYVHDKKVALNGKSGKEYMMYTDHDKYLKSTYTKINQASAGKFENMTRQQLATKLVDDQIKRGVVKPENRQKQIQSRLVGQFKMSKEELIEYAKKYL